jgi:hypothetical protein
VKQIEDEIKECERMYLIRVPDSPLGEFYPGISTFPPPAPLDPVSECLKSNNLEHFKINIYFIHDHPQRSNARLTGHSHDKRDLKTCTVE